MDKVTLTLLEGLKQALAEPSEQRLFRSGKLPGLFSVRTGSNAEAAAWAVREGLLEVVHTETRGKTVMEWVRPTPAAVDFVHVHESPVAALREMHAALRTTQQGLPAFVEQLQAQLEEMTGQVLSQVRAMGHRLDALSERVEQAIRRAEATQPALPEPLSHAVPWARDALNYLERRDENSPGPCPLSELFFALRGAHPDLTIADFHTGLRRLSDRVILRLLPLPDAGHFAEPEYALLDGFQTYYFVSRANQAA